jgi:uncharacterized membrane protein
MKTFRPILPSQAEEAVASGSTVVRNVTSYILTVTDEGKSLGIKEYAAVSAIDKTMQALIAEGKVRIHAEPAKKVKASPKKTEEAPAEVEQEVSASAKNDDSAPVEEVSVEENVDSDEVAL